MKIPIGCSIDRKDIDQKTGKRTDRYREGTAEEARGIVALMIRASSAIDQERKQAAMIAAGKGASHEKR